MNIPEFLNPTGWLNDSGGPRYLQLRRRIEDGISKKLLPPGASLPPEREMAAITEMSRVTVRKAISELVEAGLVFQKQGSGSFIAEEAPRVEQSLSRLTSFSEDMHRRGMSTKAKWLSRTIRYATPNEMMILGLSSDEMVTELSRLRSADGRPMAIERAVLPASVLPDPMKVDNSLYSVLEENGMRPVRAMQRITAENLNSEDAGLLKVEIGMAGLSIKRTSYLESGRAIEYTRSVYRGDVYDFVAELQLSGGLP